MSRGPGKGWITAGNLARPDGMGVSRGPGKGWITAGSLAGPSAKRAARGPGRAGLAPRAPAAACAGPGGPRSAADALAARSAPSGLSALSGGGTPMAARGSPRRQGASRIRLPRLRAFRGSRAYRGNWYAEAPSGEWLRRSRSPWRNRRQRLLRLMGVGR